MRDIQGFARESDVAGVINARVKGPDERSSLRGRVSWPHDAGDASGFILHERPAAKAYRGVGDVRRKRQRTLAIEAHVQVHSHKHAPAWVWRHVGNHHRAECLVHARPAEDPAVQRRAEVEGVQRETKADVAGVVQPDRAQFTYRESSPAGSALSLARDLLNAAAARQEEPFM